MVERMIRVRDSVVFQLMLMSIGFSLTIGCGGAERQIAKGRLADAERSCNELEGYRKSDCFKKVGNAYFIRNDLAGTKRCCLAQDAIGKSECLHRVATAYDTRKQPAEAAPIFTSIGDHVSAAKSYQTAGDNHAADKAWSQALVTSSIDCVDHGIEEKECFEKLDEISAVIGDPKRICKIAKSASSTSYEQGASVTFGTLADADVHGEEKENSVMNSKRFRLVGDRLRDYVKYNCSVESSH